MLSHCAFTLTFELLSISHFGTGEQKPLSDLRKVSGLDKDQQASPISLIQRDSNGNPCIEATTLRGGLNALFKPVDDECAAELFGEETDEGNAEAGTKEGRLWVYAAEFSGCAVNAKDLPLWSAQTQSFILAGNKRDRDLNSVEKGFLYNVEYLPAGTIFKCSIVFHGTTTELKREIGPLLALIANKDGFFAGGERGYGRSKLRLVDEAIDIVETHYSVTNQDFEAVHSSMKVAPETAARTILVDLELACVGPFLIQDPWRSWQRKGSDDSEEWQKQDKVPDLLELRTSKGNTLLTGKAITQELRARSAWLERIEFLEDEKNGFNYNTPELRADDADHHFRPGDRLDDLTRTQRIFGVTGWGKALRVEEVRLDPAAANQPARSATQGIQLDVLTQGPIDGALLTVDCPADLLALVRLSFAAHRYEGAPDLLEADLAHLEKVISSLATPDSSVRYGHGGGAGFGWFKVVNYPRWSNLPSRQKRREAEEVQ